MHNIATAVMTARGVPRRQFAVKLCTALKHTGTRCLNPQPLLLVPCFHAVDAETPRCDHYNVVSTSRVLRAEQLHNRVREWNVMRTLARREASRN